MKLITLAIFLLSISTSAFSEEKMMSCDKGTFKYVKKLIFKDKVYKRINDKWVEWHDGEYDTEVYGDQYTAFFMDITIQLRDDPNKPYSEVLDFLLLKHTYKIENVVTNPPVENATYSDDCEEIE